MNWNRIHFGNYRGKSLPQLIFEDADYFFFLYENYFFHGDLAKEADELYRKARSIKIPPKNGQNMCVKYFSYYDRKSKKDKFLMMKLIPDGPDLGPFKVASWIDFYVPRSYSDFDKTGYKNFVVMLKGILFGNRSLRMNMRDCEDFFNDKNNFDMRRAMQL
jgi:hypothetical protein